MIREWRWRRFLRGVKAESDEKENEILLLGEARKPSSARYM